MNFTDGVCEGLSNFFNLKGRMSRSAYWWYALFVVIVVVAVAFLVVLANGAGEGSAKFINLLFDIGFYYILLIPGIRRLHDIDKSGKNALWGLLPIIGWIYLIYLYCQPSDPDENYYGYPSI